MNPELLQTAIVALLVGCSFLYVARGIWRSLRAMHEAKAGSCGGCSTCGGCPTGSDRQGS